MAVFVSLFRAINVGGNNKVSMVALKGLHEELGLQNVVTYLQTGNVIFESDEKTDSTHLAGKIRKEFEKNFGFSPEVMVRTAAEIMQISEENPFLGHPEKETKWIVVMFLSGSPDVAAKEALLSAYTGPEEMVVKGQELYAYYTNGIGRSKLTNALIEKKLKMSGTGRNWNTVSKLLELTRRI